MKNIFIAVFSALAFCSVSFCQTDIQSGYVSGTWTKENSPYRIKGEITVVSTLTIEPGVIVDFDGYYRMYIFGQIIAMGVPDDSISFTRVTNDELMNPDTSGLADTSNYNGAWGGLVFDNYSSGTMKNCIVEFVSTIDNTKSSIDDLFGTIHIMGDCDVSIKQSAIRNNYSTYCGGIFTQGTLLLDSCMIRDNTAFGNADYFQVKSIGGVYIRYNNDTRITNNIFYNNKAFSYGHGAIAMYSATPLIKNNFISNNIAYSGGGILCSDSHPWIIQNLIVNNESDNGGAIYFQGGGGRLVNNTICNNKTILSTSAALDFEQFSGIIAKNNLISGNTYNSNQPGQIYLGKQNSTPIFTQNLIGMGIEEVLGADNGAIKVEDNYFGNPFLVNSTSSPGAGEYSIMADWALMQNSPAINTGTSEPVNEFSIEKDITQNLRINYGHVDIGCFEYRLSSYSPPADINSPEIWIADTVYITSDMNITAKLDIYPGVVVCYEGNHNISISDSLYAIGTPDAPVLFTILDTAGYSNPDSSEGGWGQIRLQNYFPKIFKHCRFEYGKVKYDGSSVAIFRGSSTGNILFKNCEFNRCYGISAEVLDFFSSSDISFISNRFVNNRTTSSNAVIGLNGSNFILKNNLIINNPVEQWLIYIQGANVDIINNSVFHNNGTIAIRCSNLNFINNTVVHNTHSVSLWDGDNANFFNSIVTKLSISHDYNIYSCYVPSFNCSGDCFDLLTDPPVFKNPLGFDGPGDFTQILTADYSLSSISPGIDFGFADTSGLGLPMYDISGNPRINNDRIDLGAYEHQGGLPVISGNPTGGSFCVNDNHVLNVTYEFQDSVFFQWIKDGIVIPGAKADSLVLDSITSDNEGNYHCIITNSYGSENSTSAYIKVISPPEILVQPEDSWQEPGETVIMQVLYTGSTPLNFQWELDGLIIPGANLPEYRFVPSDSSHEGEYTCTISNQCRTVRTNPSKLFLAPQICMVTVSETSGHNLIIWEKKSIAPIMAYNVYRESSAAGIYDRLVTIPYDDLSVFVDTMADPTVQAYLYKITAIDTAGNETDADLCKPHKTIHLLVSTNPELNTTQLEWDRYYGFEYASYFILRSVDGSVFSQVHDMSSNLHSWTDPDPVEGELVYRIAVERPDPCYPTDGSKKAGTGPYNHSLSNLDDNRLRAGQIPPDTITLSNNSIEEENMPTMMIGKLFTEDEDSIDSHTYQFVPGDGDDDNISFTLLGDLLLASESFDYETKDQYSIRIRSTDQAGNYCEVPFIIQIIDIDETTGLPVISTGSVKAYPNPFSHTTTVVFPNQEGKPYRMFLMNIAGKVVKAEAEITTSRFNIERGNLENGLYFIELRGEKIFRGKLVVE